MSWDATLDEKRPRPLDPFIAWSHVKEREEHATMPCPFLTFTELSVELRAVLVWYREDVEASRNARRVRRREDSHLWSVNEECIFGTRRAGGEARKWRLDGQ